jgi:hypothetical protein
MENLLSGFIGALIATILSVAYLYVAEQIRLRTEVALEVVGYCDDVYNRLQSMHVHKDKVYTKTSTGLEPEVYRAISRELSVLIKSTKTHAKLEIAYGASDSVAALNRLSYYFREASSILWGATENDWSVKGKEILTLFEKVIDPMRTELQHKLIDGTRVRTIAKHFFIRCWKNVT